MGAKAAGPPALSPKFILLAFLVSFFTSPSWHFPATFSDGVPGDDHSLASDALLKFKSKLSYNPAFDTWNPNTNPSPCSDNYAAWQGVLCSEGYVWGIQLENMGLTGELDIDALLPIHSLRTISLKNNSFAGPMPDWAKLGALKSLFVSDNRFSGQVDKETFRGMSSLKKVYLANNNLTGTIPTSLSTPRLLELRMENNQFTGFIPELRPGLKVFNVSNNQLEGPIPSSLAKMDLTSFSGNKNLCGPPLQKLCNGSLSPLPDEPDDAVPPPPPSSSSSSSHNGIIIAIAAVLAVVIMIVLLLIYRRSKKVQSPRFGTVLTQKQVNNMNSFQPGGLIDTYNKSVNSVPLPSAPSGAAKKGNSHEASKLSFVRDDRQHFDLQDLLRASAEVLGSGNFGSSYKAVLMDGHAVVVKRFKQMNNVGREDFHEHMRRLGRLVHPNLLPLVAYYYRKEEKLLVFDFIKNGSLASRLHGKHSTDHPALDWPTRLKIIKGVAKGLVYLHAQLPSVSLPHGHLKSSNVVLDKNYEPLLMDYALVPVVNQDQVQNLLVAYRSPEYAQHRRATRKTDVWNLGILILEILTSKFPANFLVRETAPGYSFSSYISELATWVDSTENNNAAMITDVNDTSKELKSVWDPDMRNTKDGEGEMRKLLKIGVVCCEEDLDKRWDLNDAVARIEGIKEKDDTSEAD